MVHRNFHAGRAVKLDELVLQQIVENLLSNVEKYASQGGWVKITTSCVDDLLTVTVADNGPGIPINMREQVFEPFFRMDNSLEAAAGTGIGLANVRTLAKLHGGNCQIIDSECGSVFKAQIKVLEIENSSQDHIS
jgi:signal transduction histidine kinase